MRWQEVSEGVGRITKQNQTVDVGPDEVTKQAAKFGNKVDKDGRPPTLSKKVKGKSTNVLFNLGLAEGYKLQLERDKEMLVLNITDTATGKRTEVRGKPGYETGNYDPNDSLHILLDKVGKSANISDLMNGEVVGINPKHPDADRAKKATDVAYNEITDIEENFLKDLGANIKDKAVKLKNALSQEGGETAEMMDIYKRAMKKQASPQEIQKANAQFKDVLKMVGLGAFNAIPIPGASLLIIAVEKLLNKKGMSVLPTAFQESIAFENFADGKKKGKSRPGRVKKAGASCNGSVTALRKRAKNASGEKAKMYHWCANMKSGRKKK